VRVCMCVFFQNPGMQQDETEKHVDAPAVSAEKFVVAECVQCHFKGKPKPHPLVGMKEILDSPVCSSQRERTWVCVCLWQKCQCAKRWAFCVRVARWF